jgi:hypothetical protein
MTTVTLDLGDEPALAASLAKLDPGQRERLMRVLRAVESNANDELILAKIREVIAEDCPWVDVTGKRRTGPDGRPVQEGEPMPIGVVFGTSLYPSGYFLSSNGEVLFDNGEVDTFDFGDLDDLLNGEFGIRGPDFTVGVDLRTGEIDEDDEADDIHTRFGLTPPKGPGRLRRLMRALGEGAREGLSDALRDD